MEQDNLNNEQIATIAELLGQKETSSYCTMDVMAKNITAFLYVMLGRTFQGKTVNYQCVVDALKEIPTTAFDALQDLIVSINASKTNTSKLSQDLQKLERNSKDAKAKMQDALSCLHKEQQRAVMFEHLFMEKSEMGQIIRSEISSHYKVAELYTQDGREWSETRTGYQRY